MVERLAVDGIMALLFVGVATASTFLVIGRSRGWFSPKVHSESISTSNSSPSEIHVTVEEPKATENVVVEAPKTAETTQQTTVQPSETRTKNTRRNTRRRSRRKKVTKTSP